MFGPKGERLNLFYKHLSAQFEACAFDKMRYQDLLTYTILFYIPEIDLKEQVIKLWNTKEQLGEHLLPQQVLTLMETWHDVRNQASDKISGSEHKVFSLTGGDSLVTATK